MLEGTHNMQISACGVTVGGEITENAISGIEPVDTSLPVGHAGTLTTATIAMVTGHGLTNGTFDVHGDGWCRYGCTIDFTGDSAAVTGGAGDALADGAVVVTAAVSLDVTFDGDNLRLIGVGASQQTHVQFVDSGGSSVGTPFLLSAGGVWGWAYSLGTASPLAGNAVVGANVSNGSSTLASAFKMTGLQHAS